MMVVLHVHGRGDRASDRDDHESARGGHENVHDDHERVHEPGWCRMKEASEELPQIVKRNIICL